ncbi:DALR anticodon-binding domain-containing protein [Ruania halotolerans]|uniref:DALR anticodon-binding domain-containing protein n=1 Tax=Ruania halotolerans TaxID=2897773 RepID=UPI001E2C6FD6|nr:DALR anticodon-binding domain-containing protein [Ruania halotolerans]UFU07639.1 hypothetical protein LQF10_05930 [Ruania halotolerans]
MRIWLSSACLLRVIPPILTGALADLRPSARTSRGGTASEAFERVQFAHARARNVSRIARAHGVRPADLAIEAPAAVDLQLPDRRLLVALAGARSALDAGTERSVQAHARVLAAIYQTWFTRTRTAPRGAEAIASGHRTRLALNDAVAVALATELTALGLDAPEHL